jgi:hypothetical protein
MKSIVGEIKTPEFQGTHLWNRLCWAKDNLERFQTTQDSVSNLSRLSFAQHSLFQRCVP